MFVRLRTAMMVRVCVEFAVVLVLVPVHARAFDLIAIAGPVRLVAHPWVSPRRRRLVAEMSVQRNTPVMARPITPARMPASVSFEMPGTT